MRFRSLFPAAAALLILSVLLTVPASVLVFEGRGTGRLTFVIDAGHGGEDGGAVGSDGTLESEINLAVALRLEQLLGLCGYPSVLTRRTAELVYPETAGTTRERKRADLEYRVALVNGAERAVLLSIHQNKYSASGPKGAQVFYGEGSESEAFAKELQEKLSVLCGNHRKAASISPEIYLLRNVRCPAVLVECGFLSNPGELALLKTEAYQTKLALAMTSACIARHSELEKSYGEG